MSTLQNLCQFSYCTLAQSGIVQKSGQRGSGDVEIEEAPEQCLGPGGSVMLAEDAIAIAESDPASWAARNAVIDLHRSIPPPPLWPAKLCSKRPGADALAPTFCQHADSAG